MSAYRVSSSARKKGSKLSRPLKFHAVPSLDLIDPLCRWNKDMSRGKRGASESETSSLCIRPIGSRNVPTALLFRCSGPTSALVRATLVYNGIIETSTQRYNLWWSSTSQPVGEILVVGLHRHINLFPAITEITRKDRLIAHIRTMAYRFGSAHFDFLPKSWLLPSELSEFTTHVINTGSLQRTKYILKPKNGARGEGISILSGHQIIRENHLKPIVGGSQALTTHVISEYISNPMLIDGRKFDMRLYVVITGVNPLSIYIYREGLIRLASQPYSTDAEDNPYVHLTNYSLNKGVSEDDFLKRPLSEFLESRPEIKRQIDRIIVNTVAAYTHHYPCVEKAKFAGRRSFNLLGFDIMISETGECHLIEVNLSPSLNHNKNQLDFSIKSRLLADLFTLIGIRRISRGSGMTSGNRPSTSMGRRRPKTAGPGRQKSALDPPRLTHAASTSRLMPSDGRRSPEAVEALPPNRKKMIYTCFAELERAKSTPFECLFPSFEHMHVLDFLPQSIKELNTVFCDFFENFPSIPLPLSYTSLDDSFRGVSMSEMPFDDPHCDAMLQVSPVPSLRHIHAQSSQESLRLPPFPSDADARRP